MSYFEKNDASKEALHQVDGRLYLDVKTVRSVKENDTLNFTMELYGNVSNKSSVDYNIFVITGQEPTIAGMYNFRLFYSNGTAQFANSDDNRSYINHSAGSFGSLLWFQLPFSHFGNATSFELGFQADALSEDQDGFYLDSHLPVKLRKDNDDGMDFWLKVSLGFLALGFLGFIYIGLLQQTGLGKHKTPLRPGPNQCPKCGEDKVAEADFCYKCGEFFQKEA